MQLFPSGYLYQMRRKLSLSDIVAPQSWTLIDFCNGSRNLHYDLCIKFDFVFNITYDFPRIEKKSVIRKKLILLIGLFR